VLTQLDSVPHPVDAERQLVHGADPDHVLVLGNGAAMGFGVRSQELALPGALARALAAATGRGASVDVVARRGTTITAIGDLMAEARVQRYDAIVLAVGGTDAYGLLPIDRWREQVVGMLALVEAAAAPSTEILLLAATPLQHALDRQGPFDRAADRLAAQLDDTSEEACRGRSAVTFVRVPASQLRSAPRTSDGYAALAEVLVPHLAQPLDALAADPPDRSARRLRGRADPELLRQAALEHSGLLHVPSDERLQRLVSSAKDLFGTSGAALTLIGGGGRQVQHTSVGLDGDAVSGIDAVSSRTIRGDGVLVIDDLAAGAQSAGAAPSAGRPVRFYAGYPIQSPDGFRIGALSVFGDSPRSASPLETEALAELATRVQNHLWSQAARASVEPHEQPAEPRGLPRPGR
jgi:hypothetical protein